MTSKDERIEELTQRSTLLFELDAIEPNPEADDDGVEDDRGASVVITSWDGGTLVVEAGVDRRGQGFLVASGFDEEGDPVAPVVFDSGDSILVQLDTTVRQE